MRLRIAFASFLLLFPLVAFGQNAKPWESVVRIKVGSGGSRFAIGSGTVIHSTDAESIILTCAHLFPGSNIRVDLFDGQPQSRFSGQTYKATLIDSDKGRDVALVRFKPGRKLPFTRVAPLGHSVRSGSSATAVGCPYGRDAVTWDTQVTDRNIKIGSISLIECDRAPEMGRSGGGLFSGGYLVGVCDFTEPTGNHGLYATTDSIHAILNRAGLARLYSPNRPLTQSPLVAVAPRPRKKQPVAIAFRNEPSVVVASRGGPYARSKFGYGVCLKCVKKRAECTCR